MSTKQSKIKKDSELSPDELKARSVAQLTRYLEHTDLAEELGANSWIRPKGFEDWHFVRFDKRYGFHRETARVMMMQGYTDAPKGTRCIGYENEQEWNLFLCAPPVVHRRLKAEKQKARLLRASAVNSSFDHALGQISDLGAQVSLKKEKISG